MSKQVVNRRVSDASIKHKRQSNNNETFYNEFEQELKTIIKQKHSNGPIVSSQSKRQSISKPSTQQHHHHHPPKVVEYGETSKQLISSRQHKLRNTSNSTTRHYSSDHPTTKANTQNQSRLSNQETLYLAEQQQIKGEFETQMLYLDLLDKKRKLPMPEQIPQNLSAKKIQKNYDFENVHDDSGDEGTKGPGYIQNSAEKKMIRSNSRELQGSQVNFCYPISACSYNTSICNSSRPEKVQQKLSRQQSTAAVIYETPPAKQFLPAKQKNKSSIQQDHFQKVPSPPGATHLYNFTCLDEDYLVDPDPSQSIERPRGSQEFRTSPQKLDILYNSNLQHSILPFTTHQLNDRIETTVVDHFKQIKHDQQRFKALRQSALQTNKLVSPKSNKNFQNDSLNSSQTQFNAAMSSHKKSMVQSQNQSVISHQQNISIIKNQRPPSAQSVSTSGSVSAHHRLYNMAKQQQQRKIKEKEYRDQLEKQMGFRPHINQKSLKMLEQIHQSKGGSPNTNLFKQGAKEQLSPPDISFTNDELSRYSSPKVVWFEENGQTQVQVQQQKSKPSSQQRQQQKMEILVERRIRRQIKEAIQQVLENHESTQLNFKMLHDLFYYLGTFQFSSHPHHIELLHKNRKIKEQHFVQFFWNLLKPLESVYLTQDFEGGCEGTMQPEEIQELLYQMYSIQYRQQLIMNLLHLIPEIRDYSTEAHGLTQNQEDLGNQVRNMVRNFEELNQNQLGKIHEYRLIKNQQAQLPTIQIKEIEEERECTFKPAINQRSVQIDTKRRLSTCTSKGPQAEDSKETYYSHRSISASRERREELLHKYGKDIQTKILTKQALKEKDDQQRYSYHPKISQKSKDLVANYETPRYLLPKDQSSLRYKSPVTKQYLQTKDKELTFRPKTCQIKKTQTKVAQIKGFDQNVQRLRNTSENSRKSLQQTPVKQTLTRQNSSRKSLKNAENMEQKGVTQGEAPTFMKREQSKQQDLFILSVTLCNRRQYNIPIKGNISAARQADRFTYEQGLGQDVNSELKELIKKCLQEYRKE